ncbi:hypothetical protein ACVWW1_008738 [Bradyrhizobium sp. JR3.5]
MEIVLSKWLADLSDGRHSVAKTDIQDQIEDGRIPGRGIFAMRRSQAVGEVRNVAVMPADDRKLALVPIMVEQVVSQRLVVLVRKPPVELKTKRGGYVLRRQTARPAAEALGEHQRTRKLDPLLHAIGQRSGKAVGTSSRRRKPMTSFAPKLLRRELLWI